MSASPTNLQTKLERLRTILQDDIRPAEFEKLVAALISSLTGVGIAVAKTGFQHGGDAGPSGRQGRRFRIETKRYADSTSLSDRELLGEVDDALTIDPALEIWILAATREVPEQLELKLMRKADETGVPIIIIDWKSNSVPALAALCSSSPSIVRDLVGTEAGNICEALKTGAKEALDRLVRDLSSWGAGFERLRAIANDRLQQLWTSPALSAATLGQNAAGGSRQSTIRRLASYTALSQWWTTPPATDAPIVVMGLEGMGKTWATLDWLVNMVSRLPLSLVVPSNAMSGFGEVSEGAIKRMIAERLCEATQARDSEHWYRRVNRLFKQPIAEGPVLLIFFDGVNQEPSVDWPSLLARLQTEPFSGRVRVILTTRQHHFEQRLSSLRNLINRPERIVIGQYDDTPGSELDLRLAAENMVRQDLHEDLIPLARTPRLFNLVVQFGERLVNAGQVTVHRLLWEYGRDSFGERAGKSFSELEWRQWLQGMAEQHLGGIRRYSLKELAQTTERADLSHTEVARRLSDIIDSQFIQAASATSMKLSSTLVNHALGMALLHHLDELVEEREETLMQDLHAWLDPISGMDQRAEILRAAVSIMVERGVDTNSSVSTALVSEWLSSQNIPEQHASELMRLACFLATPLLGTIEIEGSVAQRTARLWAVKALRSTSRKDEDIRAEVIARAIVWLKTISRDAEHPNRQHEEQDKARSSRLIQRIGVDDDGHRTVLGVPIELVHSKQTHHEALIPLLLEGYPLAPALPIFELAAVTLAIRGRNELWDDLKWMCLFNTVDFDETAHAIKIKANQILYCVPESGINPQLAARSSALLLWLSGDESNEVSASACNPPLDRGDYKKDYLNDPGRSFYRLERRHADQVLSNADLPWRSRVDRTRLYWTDPAFVPPEAFTQESAAYLRKIDVLLLDSQRAPVPADHFFEQSLPAMARAAPKTLIDMLREKHISLPKRPSETTAIASARFCREFLLFDTDGAESARSVRLARKQSQPVQGAEVGDEAAITNDLLIMETALQSPFQQAVTIIDAAPPILYLDLLETIQPLSTNDLQELITRFGMSDEKATADLLDIMAMQQSLGAEVWPWLEHQLAVASAGMRAAVLRVCYQSDPVRLGQLLSKSSWSWLNEEAIEAAHWGSLGLIEASSGWPFEQVCEQVAPWLLLKSLAIREVSATDIQLCVDYLGAVIDAPIPEIPVPGSEISVRLKDRARSPSCFSVTPILDSEGDPLAQFLAFGTEEQDVARQRAVDTAVKRVKEARQNGALFHLQDFAAADFKEVLTHNPAAVDQWLRGAAENSLDFRRRLRFAEGFYLALCEALFHTEPDRAKTLWSHLRSGMATKFNGIAEISELTHMLFRVPCCLVVDTMLDNLLSLSETHTDSTLLEISICAFVNGRQDWLDAIIERDLASEITWQRQRGIRLQGFICGNQLPIDVDWPIGVQDSPTSRATESTLLRHHEACARYWWNAYWEEDCSTSAYLAWNLFCASADSRIYAWMNVEQIGHNLPPRERARRLIHMNLNLDQLKAMMKKREKDLVSKFLGRSIGRHIGPWAYAV
ncbi:hypothetical protein GHO25_04080 [Pseudomonas sp. FSL R10-1350]|uniref:hypothetical protein n=1 Tax=Pseudomonas sp. FSL R10-1350 TaxID=2662197 RepID=UPI00129609C7|nr:hypothetical protein [Pseudomonas sp. FSL R10-1350]MQU62306.1 hypothetical protein [Pseudomonas sp. FSL R10-1350]